MLRERERERETRGCGEPLLRRELGVLAGNRGNGCATHLDGREARC